MEMPPDQNEEFGLPPRKSGDPVDIDINALPTMLIQELAEIKGMLYAVAQQVAQIRAADEGIEPGLVLEEISTLADDVARRMLEKMIQRISKSKGGEG